MQACYRITDLIIINVIHAICCLPIITIGAAMSALYTVTIKMAKDEETTPISKEYFRAFKNNFKQSTLLWAVMLIFGMVIYMDFRISTVLESSTAYSLLVGFLVAVSIIYMCVCTYLFPLIAWFENSNMQMLKNAFRLSASYLQYTIPIVIINLTPLLSVFVPGGYLKWILALYFFIWFSGAAYLNGKIFRVIFDKIS